MIGTGTRASRIAQSPARPSQRITSSPSRRQISGVTFPASHFGAKKVEPEQPHQIGRSRPYTPADTPGRLRQWHAPRINRWERICVTSGTLVIECFGATGVTSTTVTEGEKIWFGPGTRWRVASMDANNSFELEIHADSKGQAEAPQQLRSELLEETERVVITDVRAFETLVQALPAGERRIVEGHFDFDGLTKMPFGTRTLFWHPLERRAGCFIALIGRSRQCFDLAGYLGRDHAVIEAALGGALAGDAEKYRWLCAILERHLHIEEELVFPAYLESGGRQAWVRGLKNEHKYLRQYLCELDKPAGRRKFLRLLDGHDEREEQVVYPDVLVQLGERADELLVPAITYSLPEKP